MTWLPAQEPDDPDFFVVACYVLALTIATTIGISLVLLAALE